MWDLEMIAPARASHHIGERWMIHPFGHECRHLRWVPFLSRGKVQGFGGGEIWPGFRTSGLEVRKFGVSLECLVWNTYKAARQAVDIP